MDQLKLYNNWVNWKYQLRDGKKVKPPINPQTGRYAKANDPTTWGTYQQAVDNVPLYAGIGFMFHSETVNLVGIDLDNCIDSKGKLSSFAKRVVNEIPSYWEFSPSGKGLHCFVFGNLPNRRRKHAKLGFEIYRDGRYFTITGNQLAGTADQIADCSRQLLKLHHSIFGKPSQPSQQNKNQKKSIPKDKDIIFKAMNAKSGAKFRRLWYGDFTQYMSIGDDGVVNEGRSEADFALTSMLAYWTNCDQVVMDRLFRQSGLMRPKWDEMHGKVTYGQMTIDNAIQSSRHY